MSYTSLSHKKVNIRKERRCEFCNDLHQIGDAMFYESGVMDRELNAYYLCVVCEDYIQDNREDIIDDGEISADFTCERHYKDFKESYKSMNNEKP